MLLMEKARPDRQAGRVFFVLQMLPSPIYFCCVTPMSELPTPKYYGNHTMKKNNYLNALTISYLILRAIDSILEIIALFGG